MIRLTSHFSAGTWRVLPTLNRAYISKSSKIRYWITGRVPRQGPAQAGRGKGSPEVSLPSNRQQRSDARPLSRQPAQHDWRQWREKNFPCRRELPGPALALRHGRRLQIGAQILSGVAGLDPGDVLGRAGR